MKSAADKAAAAKKKLDKKLGMRKPLFPSMWRKSVDKLKQEYAYWSALAKKEDSNALASFGEATGLDQLLGSKAAVVSAPSAAPATQVVEKPLWQHPAVIIGGLVLGLSVVGVVAARR